MGTESLRYQRRVLLEQYMQVFYQDYFFRPCRARASNNVLADLAERHACHDAKVTALRDATSIYDGFELPKNSKTFKHSPQMLHKVIMAACVSIPIPGHEKCRPKKLQISVLPYQQNQEHQRIWDHVLKKSDRSELLQGITWEMDSWATAFYDSRRRNQREMRG
jgi:hypothetical protein